MSEASTESQVMIQRLQAGDEQALGELFAHSRDRLARIVQFRIDRRLAGRVDTDDILQEAYLDAAKRLKHFGEHGSADDESQFGQQSSDSAFVWLRLVVNQTLIDVHRRHLGAQKRSAKREVALGRPYDSSSTAVSLMVHLVGNLTSPSQAVVREELEAQLSTALESMEEIDREVLALRHFEELTNSEVAEILGITQKAASIRYVRALGRLKNVLGQLPGF